MCFSGATIASIASLGRKQQLPPKDIPMMTFRERFI
jgi:hypothetical protein